MFLWLWLMGASSSMIETFTGWCGDTVHNWTNAIQDLITMVVLRDDVVIGGKDVVVEIDEENSPIVAVVSTNFCSTSS